MKALTICQPFAHLIARGVKRVENRTWSTSYRGPLAIHAGKSMAWTNQATVDRWVEWGDPMAFGAVVGMAKLIDVLHIDKIKSGDCEDSYPWLHAHEHVSGPWCWVLGDVVRIAPVKWKGAQGFWDLPDEIVGARQ